jgi:hypothetical protein
VGLKQSSWLSRSLETHPYKFAEGSHEIEIHPVSPWGREKKIFLI